MTRHMVRRGGIALFSAIVVALLTRPAGGVQFTAEHVGFNALRQNHPDLNAVNERTGEVQRVAVLDTGIDWQHPALADRVVAGANFAANFTYGSEQPADFDDLNGHGTFVAGMLGSTDPNHPGLVDGVELVSVRVLAANGQGSFGDIARGLGWVIDHAEQLNITAVNLSLGSDTLFASPDDIPGFSTLNTIGQHFATLESMGLVTAVASGNDGSSTELNLPAIYEPVVSVGASTGNDNIANFTNRNPELELLAPGVGIQSLWNNGGIRTGSGTSFAAPVTTAAAVVLRDAYLRFTDDLAGDFDSFQDRLVDLLQRTGEPIHDPASDLTFARIDVAAATASIYEEFGVAIPEPTTLMMLLAVIAATGRRARIGAG